MSTTTIHPGRPASAPAMSQPMRALQRANRVRMARCAQKRRLRALDVPEARERAASLLLDPPAELLGMTIGDFLDAVPRLGPSQIAPALARRRISESRTLESLTFRQQLELAGALRADEWGLR